MTLQQKLKRIGDALVNGLTVNGKPLCGVYHYWRPQMESPFCVWAEDGEDTAASADNHKQEQAVSGFVDYYTKTEYDGIIDTIQNILNGITGFPFGWRLASVQYEDDTNLIHYQWTWSVA